MTEEQLKKIMEIAFYAGMSVSKHAPESPKSSFEYWYYKRYKEGEADEV